ncbi:hypothetical protein KSP40_PGU005305 [Platanthera guangdongensis]|uniref:Uncharacterized protein n=1 Tax=Platanthera guangdongensis TaxID=2320717 RepID=A0ABR2LS24_9ASPA
MHYYQNSGYTGYSQSSPPLPLHLLFFFLTLLLFLSLSWYLSYESVWESVVSQFRFLLIVSLLVLLLVVHRLSCGPDRGRSAAFFTAPPPQERQALHRGRGSPFGVGLLLALLLLMVSFRF